MAIFACGRAAGLLILVLIHLVSAQGNGDILTIRPPGDPQSKPTGQRLMLTCSGGFDSKPELFSNMQWLDPYGRPIESRSTFQSQKGSLNGPGLYTETLQAGLSLVFNPLREEQAGRYTCSANYANEPFNKTVSVEPVESLTWVDAPEHQFAILDREYKIRCEVKSRPPPTVNWLKDDDPITTNEHYIVEIHSLKINNVQFDDQGVYTCQAAVVATGEVDERKISLEVLEEPKIEEFERDINITEGESATIRCKAHGTPPPRISWIKSLTKENLTTINRFAVNSDDGILTIDKVNREDGGEYQCIAENRAGIATANVKFIVLSKPKIMEFLNRTMAVGKQVDITCRVFGRPAPEVTFRKHTSLKPFIEGIQPEDDRITLRTSPNNQIGETIATLSISDVLRKDDGLYECIAKNSVGPAYLNGHLTVEFPPSFASMQNQTVWSWEQRPVNLTCIAESIPNATIRWLLNDVEIDRTEMAKNIKVLGNGPISTLSVLPHDNRYYGNYKCVATNTHGMRDHVIVLREAQRPGHVQQVLVAEITATTIVFNITPPPAEPELPIQAIDVQYKENTNRQNWHQAKNRTWTLNSLYVVENLKPATSYEFRFRGRNQVGEGNWGEHVVHITPQRTAPQKPKMKMRKENANYDESIFANQYEVSWITPPDNGEPIDQYDIQWCETVRTEGEFNKDTSTCRNEIIRGMRTSHWLKDLKSNTFYQADVRAHNALGYGEPGYVYFRTAPESSGSTVDYSIISAGDTSKPLRAIVTAIAIVSLAI